MSNPKFRQAPVAVIKYMQAHSEPEEDVATYIARAIAAYYSKPGRTMSLDGYIATKLGCTLWQASRVIQWVKWRGAQ
jgi:hypothetical protein